MKYQEKSRLLQNNLIHFSYVKKEALYREMPILYI